MKTLEFIAACKSMNPYNYKTGLYHQTVKKCLQTCQKSATV